MSQTAQWIAKGVLQVSFDAVSTSGAAVGAGGIGVPNLPDKSIQAFGTFNSAAWRLEGSNASTPTVSGAYKVLSTPSGADISALTSDDIVQVLENPRWYRFAVSGATGNTNVTAEMICYANPR